MKYTYKAILTLALLTGCFSCTSTKQLKITFIEPSPVDLSDQIKKIGIVNTSNVERKKKYTTTVQQLIVMEERWLAEKGTEAALTGLFDELAEDTRFETVKILDRTYQKTSDFGSDPDDATWQQIALICENNGVDAIFSLASHYTETEFSFKRTKLKGFDLMRNITEVAGQEITLKTLIENGWRIYDPKRRILIDEFTTNEQMSASAKGRNQLDALQAIDNRRENLLKQSKQSGSSYGHRMQPRKLDVYRDYYVSGSQKLELADDKIENGAYSEASKLWEQEISNPKTKISSRACYNLAVLSEYDGDLDSAMKWAVKSYNLDKIEGTRAYIIDLKNRLTDANSNKTLANTVFVD